MNREILFHDPEEANPSNYILMCIAYFQTKGSALSFFPLHPSILPIAWSPLMMFQCHLNDKGEHAQKRCQMTRWDDKMSFKNAC